MRTAQRRHRVRRLHPGWVAMDAHTSWREFVAIATDLTVKPCVDATAIGVSDTGPCVVTGDDVLPLRPAILYGVDARASVEIPELTERPGAKEVLERGASALTTQAVGPKVAWLAQHEPSASIIQPDVSRAADYEERFDLHRRLQTAVNDVSHALAQRHVATPDKENP